jgi:pimeloyl-ACP methyl ester carboxylesterase
MSPLDPRLNLRFPTFGGKQLWADEFLYAGYRIQQNEYSGHHRLLGPDDTRLAWGTWTHCHEAFTRLREGQSIARPSKHLVLLLHGVFRSKDSWGPMTRALRRAGYDAQPVNYPSTRRSLVEHAEQIERILDRSEDVAKVSFVCHSMGGIVTRMLLGRPGAWRSRIEANRLVMIATPNGGAEIAEAFKALPMFGATAGPSVDQLRPERIAEIPIPNIPFGTIAGSSGRKTGYNPLLPGDDDMTVTVESTRLEGAEDELTVQAVHTFVMVKPEVVAATLRYLKSGRFRPAEEGE